MNLQENIHRIKSMMGLIIEEKEIEKSNSKVIFRKDGDKDIGACIGIAHGGEIYLPQIILDRIKNIVNTKGQYIVAAVFGVLGIFELIKAFRVLI